MDTDDLSKEAYNAIIIEAENFNHDLTLQFGLLSYECLDENQFLEKSVRKITELKKIKLGDLDEIFYDKIPDIKEFKNTLDKILNNIAELDKVPLEKRKFD